jgi:hypothetical protein
MKPSFFLWRFVYLTIDQTLNPPLFLRKFPES